MSALTQHETDGVAREHAEKVLDGLPFDGIPGHGPFLREGAIEGLPDGSWVIDYQAGTERWAAAFAEEACFCDDDVAVKEIRPRVLGIYPTSVVDCGVC